MRKSDIEPDRTSRPPDGSRIIMDTEMQNQGFVISRIELRQYIERSDAKLGDYSLLTVLVETDRGSVEMKYDEGFRGADALESAATMLTRYVGLASLINRALIELQG
ncbi:MAG TPA: hypothetical protein VIB07_07835 [Nitrososphaera sp.]|jgi:hypothetical protein